MYITLCLSIFFLFSYLFLFFFILFYSLLFSFNLRAKYNALINRSTTFHDYARDAYAFAALLTKLENVYRLITRVINM